MNTKSLIFAKILTCRKCKLWKVRRQVVLGRGTIPARLLLIGEAPGRIEDLKGEAYLGKPGKLLDTMLNDACSIGLDLPLIMPTFCIINTVLCHPTDVFAGPNREPDKEEVFACLPNIDYLIKAIQPEKIILIGDIASSYYKKEFPDATVIMQPSTLEKKGGTVAPSYLHNVRLIQEVIQSLQMKHLRRLYA